MTTLYTVNEAAKLTKQSTKTIYRLVASGTIAHYRPNGIRGGIRIKDVDLAAYMESGRIASNAELQREVTA